MLKSHDLSKLLCLGTALLLGHAFAGADPVVVEAESFAPSHDAPGWQAGKWGENLYASTFANTFLSRKAFLGAPAEVGNAVATTDIDIPAAGEYLALVRYEAAPGFQTQFTLRIEQKGKVWERLYGARDNLKIWAFHSGLKTEVVWPWGATENIVWEGHDAKVNLQAGPARLSLIATNQPVPAARRDVDAVMLTTDEANVANRIAKEGYLPLDGLLTQSGDLFARIHNKSAQPLAVTIPPGREHSSYSVHIRTWKPVIVQVLPQQTTPWMEVGSLLDTLNDGQWEWRAPGAGLDYDVEFGVPAKGGAIDRIRLFPDLRGDVVFAYDADTRDTHRIRLQEEVLYELVDNLEHQKVHGKAPERTLIYGYTFDPHPENAKYTAALAKFIQLTGATALAPGYNDKLSPLTANGLRRGYLDVPGQTPAQLEEIGKKMQAAGTAADIAVISLGDEIGLPAPTQNDQTNFRTWLQAQNVTPAALGAANWDGVAYSQTVDARQNPVLFYYSKLYADHCGIQAMKEKTDVLKQYFPNAGIGANYSPHGGAESYLGKSYSWAKLFREGGMTMPWSEDYAWQIPIGSQQMAFFDVDVFRAGIENRPNEKIQMYVMAHSPGNTPAMWRRIFYGDIAHGVKIFNLYEFRPVQAAYTENWVNGPDMYREVRQALYELGTFEDIVQDGKVLPAQVGLWHSETGDIWDDDDAPFGPAKRALYVAIRHQQLPLDIAVDAGDLKDLKVLYLTDRHVSRADSQAISDWVKGGGQLFATAGAGMRDEFDRPNTTMRELLGVNEEGLEESKEPMRWIKEDLPLAAPLDTATLAGPAPVGLPALGAISRIKTTAHVVATFQDGSPAVTTQTAGEGSATYCAFLPGLSYFKPAIPLRPVDRGSTDDSFAHFIPSNFDIGAAGLIGGPAAGIERPVVCGNPLVETTVIQSPEGTAIVLDNWSGAPVKDLNVILNLDAATKNVKLASGAPLKAGEVGGKKSFLFNLDVADALILR